MKRISLFLAMALLLAVVPMGAWAEAIAPDGLDLAQDLEAADEAIELPGLALDVPNPVSEAIPARRARRRRTPATSPSTRPTSLTRRSAPM